MSGWATITVVEDREKLDEMADGDFADFKAMQTQMKEKAKEKDWYATLTSNNGHPIIQVGGYKDFEVLEDFLDEITGWEKAVILKANDTGDVGHAKYYERAESSWLGYNEDDLARIDEFEEQELAHGRPVGAKAAAYMTLHHDVYAHNSLSRPREFTDNVPEKNSEAHKKITQAYVQYYMEHVRDEKIVERLREAADMIERDIE